MPIRYFSNQVSWEDMKKIVVPNKQNKIEHRSSKKES